MQGFSCWQHFPPPTLPCLIFMHEVKNLPETSKILYFSSLWPSLKIKPKKIPWCLTEWFPNVSWRYSRTWHLIQFSTSFIFDYKHSGTHWDMTPLSWTWMTFLELIKLQNCHSHCRGNLSIGLSINYKLIDVIFKQWLSVNSTYGDICFYNATDSRIT